LCNLFSITANQAAIDTSATSDAGVFPDHPAPQRRRRRGDGPDALGHAAATAEVRAVIPEAL